MEIAEIVARLEQILGDEEREADPEALQLIARHAAGSVRDSQSLLEQLLAFTDDRLTIEEVHRMLGTAPDEQLSIIARHLAESNAAAALKVLDETLRGGIDVGQLAEQLLTCFRDAMLLANGADRDLLRLVTDKTEPILDSIQEKLGIAGTLAALQVLDHTLTQIRHSSQARTLLEMAIVRICHLGRLKDFDALLGAADSTSGSASPPRTQTSAQGPTAPVRTQSHQTATGTAAQPRPKPKQNRPAEQSSHTAQSTQPAATQVAEQPAVQPRTAPQASADAPNSDVSVPAPNTDPAGVWKEVVDRTREQVGPYAGFATQVKWQDQDRLVVAFPRGYTLHKERCERPQTIAELEAAARAVTGMSVRIVFDLVAEEQPESASSNTPPKSTNRERERSPFVRQTVELFDADVTRIDDPPADS